MYRLVTLSFPVRFGRARVPTYSHGRVALSKTLSIVTKPRHSSRPLSCAGGRARSDQSRFAPAKYAPSAFLASCDHTTHPQTHIGVRCLKSHLFPKAPQTRVVAAHDDDEVPHERRLPPLGGFISNNTSVLSDGAAHLGRGDLLDASGLHLHGNVALKTAVREIGTPTQPQVRWPSERRSTPHSQSAGPQRTCHSTVGS